MKHEQENKQKFTVLIAKVGLDGHDRGAIVLVKALRKEGFRVYYSGIRQTPSQIAELAVACRADCVGLSSLAGAHLSLFPKVTARLAEAKWDGMVIAGGIIPVQDEPHLRAAGIHAVFHPGQSVAEVASFLRETLRVSRGKPAENKVI